jgi:cell wall-associated NlpC family hydrolase
LACSLLALGLAGSIEARAAKPSWAQKEIRFVVSRGLMATDVASFRADDTLTRGELNALVAGLMQRPATAAGLADTAPVTVAQLDARLVASLGLSQAAAQFAQATRASGLPVPARFGTEVVARLLALRINHPDGQDDLELGPADPATRAEAAYSAARVLRLSEWERDGIEESAATLTLPTLTPWQQRILTTAVRLIGYPYVWAGTSERPQAPLGREVTGGFDCSGFAWRVYRLQKYPAGGTELAAVIRGRTAAAMAGEIAAKRRVRLARLQPADMVFFGPRGPRSRAASIDHMGIYLGGGWMIHSSRYGVALASLTGGWYRERFAWGRRPLAEANLARS